jgi:hypothetical protein
MLPHTEAIDAIKHPLMKAVLQTFSKLSELITKADTQGLDAAALLLALYKEIAVAKLHITDVVDSSLTTGFQSLPADVLKALGKLCA